MTDKNSSVKILSKSVHLTRHGTYPVVEVVGRVLVAGWDGQDGLVRRGRGSKRGLVHDDVIGALSQSRSVVVHVHQTDQ